MCLLWRHRWSSPTKHPNLPNRETKKRTTVPDIYIVGVQATLTRVSLSACLRTSGEDMSGMRGKIMPVMLLSTYGSTGSLWKRNATNDDQGGMVIGSDSCCLSKCHFSILSALIFLYILDLYCTGMLTAFRKLSYEFCLAESSLCEIGYYCAHVWKKLPSYRLTAVMCSCWTMFECLTAFE